MITNSYKKEIRQKKQQLQVELDGFLIKFRRQYKAFPVRRIVTLSKKRFGSEEKVKVNGYTYNIKEAIRRLRKILRSMNGRTKTGYYAHIISAFEHDATKRTSSTEINKVYQTYSKQLQVEFKSLREDFWFCINLLKELNRLSSVKDDKEIKSMTESEIVMKREIKSQAELVEESMVESASEKYHDINVAYAAGEITAEEKEALLDTLTIHMAMNEAVVEAMEHVNTMDEFMEKAKLALYEMCSDGSITLDERETALHDLMESFINMPVGSTSVGGATGIMNATKAADNDTTNDNNNNDVTKASDTAKNAAATDMKKIIDDAKKNI